MIKSVHQSLCSTMISISGSVTAGTGSGCRRGLRMQVRAQDAGAGSGCRHSSVLSQGSRGLVLLLSWVGFGTIPTSSRDNRGTVAGVSQVLCGPILGILARSGPASFRDRPETGSRYCPGTVTRSALVLSRGSSQSCGAAGSSEVAPNARR